LIVSEKRTYVIRAERESRLGVSLEKGGAFLGGKQKNGYRGFVVRKKYTKTNEEMKEREGDLRDLRLKNSPPPGRSPLGPAPTGGAKRGSRQCRT